MLATDKRRHGSRAKLRAGQHQPLHQSAQAPQPARRPPMHTGRPGGAQASGRLGTAQVPLWLAQSALRQQPRAGLSQCRSGPPRATAASAKAHAEQRHKAISINIQLELSQHGRRGRHRPWQAAPRSAAGVRLHRHCHGARKKCELQDQLHNIVGTNVSEDARPGRAEANTSHCRSRRLASSIPRRAPHRAWCSLS